MTRYESLIAHKHLLLQRIKQSKQYASPHQLRVWRKRVARYNAVIKLFSKSNQQPSTNNAQLTFA